MRRSSISVYGPFLIIALVQALVIAVAPSNVPTPQVAGAPLPSTAPPVSPAPNQGGNASTAAEEQRTGAGERPASAAAATSPPSSGVAARQGSGGASSTSTSPSSGAGVGTTPPGDDGSAGQPAPSGSEPQGDTSHCTPDGRQHGLVYHAPPCQPAWQGGDNGGATYPGVTEDTIRVVVFRENRNEVVTRILNAEGLRATEEEEVAFMNAAEAFLNKHYEFYGRQIDLIRARSSACPETPPDIEACRAEARRVIEEHQPFAVIWDVPTYPTVFDEFAKAGVVSLGGWHHDNSFFAGRRPFRWDVFMDGTRSADFIGEFYCKQMAGRNATHTGQIIHREIGARGQVPRRLGIIVPDTDATVLPANRIVQHVMACGDPEPVVVAYEQDIERSRTNATNNIAALIDAGVTTVMCMCDPIAPVFRTQAATEQNYYPEWLMSGTGLLDFDKLGRLYDQQQMAHAFGPSHLQRAKPHSDSNASVVWRDVGNTGDACQSCNLPWAYYSLIGSMLQNAGPQLTPLTLERGTLHDPPRGGWDQTGGDPTEVLMQFGRDDYSGISDLRVVYWDTAAPSYIDGRPGAYVGVDGGRRYRIGEIPGGDLPGIPVKPQ